MAVLVGSSSGRNTVVVFVDTVVWRTIFNGSLFERQPTGRSEPLIVVVRLLWHRSRVVLDCDDRRAPAWVDCVILFAWRSR
eukprot:scaffold5540_cov181-Amphora_coffeaeformis.AAC.16